MPIRAEQKCLYPANWDEIRKAILSRARGVCEWCDKPNGLEVQVDMAGNWCHGEGLTLHLADKVRPEKWSAVNCPLHDSRWIDPPFRTVTVVLTIAHLDHDPTNNDPRNLRALCQRCHNAWDAPKRARGRIERTRKGVEG